MILENVLRGRFGDLNPEIAAFLSPVSTMPIAEFTSLLLEISMLTVDEVGQQQAVRLLAENVGKIRPNELGELLPTREQETENG